MGLGKTGWGRRSGINLRASLPTIGSLSLRRGSSGNWEDMMRKLLVILALGCGVLALVGGGSLAQTKDTIIIAVPGTPQGVDLDRQSGPQTWTMAAQVMEPGAEWKPTTYPYAPTPVADPTKMPGLTRSEE